MLSLISEHKMLLAVVAALVTVVFAIGFLLAGVNNERPAITEHSATASPIPISSLDRESLLKDLMAAGHWEAEPSEDSLLHNQLNLQNFHTHLTLVGVYETKGVQEVLFIVNAQSGWQSAIKDSTNGLEQVNVTPDGRLRAGLGEEIAPDIEILAINTNKVDLSVSGELYTKYLYALARPE